MNEWNCILKSIIKISKIIGIKCFCPKITMADLCKIGLKMEDDVSENLAPKFHSNAEAMSLAPLPPVPKISAPLPHILCLTSHEWSLTYCA